MCGIIGIHNLSNRQPIEEHQLRLMLGLVRHRGPDQFGIYLDSETGLGSARLSIIDLSGGQQPIANEDDSVWIVYNGEVFNYVELRPELEERGHQFSTNTDTEVILHLYEDFGPQFLNRLNGQFSIAIWDTRNHSLFLARDRLGIRPLFYTIADGALIFGSEIKTLLADPRVVAELDPESLDQIFTYWSTLQPRTAFKNIWEVPPGHYLIAKDGQIKVEQYWSIDFPTAAESRSFSRQDKLLRDAYLEEFRALLIDATQIRLRADVPVAAYLSGGLDSSTTAAIIRNYTNSRLDTFSISFSDPRFDESPHQYRMADHLGTEHQVVFADFADVGQAFLDAAWHVEAPILRTAPAPMYLLSHKVRQSNYKVVMTGEGADEFLAGYDIFKESLIRRFWAKNPQSQFRPALLARLYPEITTLSSTNSAYLSAFFGEGLQDISSPTYSHNIRWRNTSRTRRFFSDALHAATLPITHPPIKLPEEFATWHPLHQAQYLEITIFLSEYLLSAQGDRVGMAHSVEGRFPFLDYRIVEFCNRLPVALKLNGLTEKYLLRQVAREWLPEEIWQRRKRPYRAPIQRSFFNNNVEPAVMELLSPERLGVTGYFKPAAVQQLINKARSEATLSETDEMALAGILSTQQIHERFVRRFEPAAPIADKEDIKVCDRRSVASH